MVGGHRTGRAAFELFPVDECAHFVAAPEIEDEPVRAARKPPQDRRDRRRCRRIRQRLGNGGRPPPQPRFRLADGVDHPFVGFFRRLAECEDPVLQQDQPFDGRIAGVRGRTSPGERETRHDVGDEPHRPAIDLAADRLAVRLVGQREDRIRVGVVDEPVRQKGVQQGLGRWVGRVRIEQVAALVGDHLLVAQAIKRSEAAQRFEPDRRKARWLDMSHVPAASLDAKHVHGIAQDVAHGRLDRRVASAVKHEARIPSQEPRRVDPERDVFRDAFGLVTVHRGSGIARRVEALHRGYPAAARRRSG